jgi:hypothetical protein
MLVFGVLGVLVRADDVAIVRSRVLQEYRPANMPKATATSLHYADTMLANGSWADISYDDPGDPGDWKTFVHIERVKAMAASVRYFSPAKNKTATILYLFTKTERALNFWLAADFVHSNWWYNDIGVPQVQ